MLKMKRVLLLAIVMVALPTLLMADDKNKKSKATKDASKEIEWLSLDEIQERMKKEPRKVYVDVYTDWCGWCKRMDAGTFANAEIIKLVNEKYYAVKFDAETKEIIVFKGKEYKHVTGGRNGYNELAAEILNGQLSYPTTVYFDQQLNEIFPVPGYQDPKMFEKVLNYVHTDSYKKMQFAEYEQGFQGKVQS